MRLVAVSVVKNEADIIEPFVRHTLAWVDHHLIFDHDSTDGTRAILISLKNEGLPISLYTDDSLANLQQTRSNHLAHLAGEVYAADWVIPLDADEIICAPSRSELEKRLSQLDSARPAALPLLNYYATLEDKTAQTNPILRLSYCQNAPSRTDKILIPRQLATDRAHAAGKGNHALYIGNTSLVSQTLPNDYYLAHLALRSPEHQVLRVVLAELQKLSRGKRHTGLDEHYRLGFQMLAEKPELFLRSVYRPVTGLRHLPILYRGQPTRYDQSISGWGRLARAILPFAEKLATSHGQLIDAANIATQDEIQSPIREIESTCDLATPDSTSLAVFEGFTAESGWGPVEGPVPEAFLPSFHWGYAPTTQLKVNVNGPGSALLVADVLTYCTSQTMDVELNGLPVFQHTFPRSNQKDHLQIPLVLNSGNNLICIHYTQALNTSYDPRHLAVIFLSLRIMLTSQ